VVVAAALVLLLAVVGIFKIHLSHDPLSWFPEGHALRSSAETVDEHFQGLMSLELIVRSEGRKSLTNPALFAGIHAFEAAARGLEIDGTRAGHVFSPVDVLERVHRVLDPDDPAPLPTRRGTLVRNAMLWEQSAPAGFGGWTADKGRSVRVSVRLPWEDAVRYPAWIEGIEEIAAATVGPHAQVEVTGATVVMSRVVNAVLSSLANSYVLALLLITPMIGLMVGNWRAGGIAMIPNLAPIAVTLGLMGWLGIPLDVFTLLVGCIAIGLAVDDTIHFMHCFERVYAREGDVGVAVAATLQSTGRALLFTSLVLSASFLSYALSPLAHIGNFGWLMASAMGLAFVALIVLAPALLTLFRSATPVSKEASAGPEEALLDPLRESAAALGCAPAWLEAGELPKFSFLRRGEDGPVLVLLHGLFGAVSNWDSVIPRLARFSRVVALDFPLLAGARSEVTVQALAVYTEAFFCAHR
jgi:preprotein translocase subunit SecF